MKRFEEPLRDVRRILLIMLLAVGIGALLVLFVGENPLVAYGALLRGAFKGTRAFGTTLGTFTPILISAMAFAVAAKAGAFNVGVEGEIFLGAITAAWLGISFPGMPAVPHMLLCFAGAVLVGALWASIPALLKAYCNVNEVCVTILMNYVALFITSYFVSGPLSAGTTVAQTPYVPEAIRLTQFMKPSSANYGLFIALIVSVLLIWMLSKTRIGYKIRMVGTNPHFSDFVGVNPRTTLVKAMMLSGALGGLAGCIEVLGVHGCFLNNFAAGMGSNGMLVALIVKCYMPAIPFLAMFLAILKAGAMGMQQMTNTPKSIIDMITAVFIIIATMETLFTFADKKTKRVRAGKKMEVSK